MECTEIEGNSNFYGLGIRIGIYLFWISAWFSNSINPKGAGTNHDANIVFVTAVLIALAVAFGYSELRMVEAYIMLMLASGFFFNALSFLGVRLYFLQPSTLTRSRRGMFNAAQEKPNTLSSTRPRKLISRDGFKRTYVYSFGAASGVKHPALSWVGFAVRTTVGTMASVLSIWIWCRVGFRENITGSDLLALAGTCDAKLYFFGQQYTTDGLLWFFRVASTIIYAPLVWMLTVIFRTCVLFVIVLLVLDYSACLQ